MSAYLSAGVCQLVCPLIYVMSKLHKISCTYYQWLGPPLATMQYRQRRTEPCTSSCMNDVMVPHDGDIHATALLGSSSTQQLSHLVNSSETTDCTLGVKCDISECLIQ